MSTQAAEKRSPTRRADIIWVVALGLGVALIYFVAAGLWGFWEPWETEFARMGRTLATTEGTSWIMPPGTGSEIVNKPWLMALLMQLGYQLGHGSELGMRAPLAFLGLVTVLGTFGWLRGFVGPHRAGVSALVLATSPLFLMSAVNLAGAMPAICTTTLALFAFSLGSFQRRGWWWTLIAGVLTGFALWGAGFIGVVLVVGTIACYGIWSISRTPRQLLSVKPILATALVGGAVLIYIVYLIVAHGFAESKNVLGMAVPLGIALTAITAAGFTEAFRSVPSQDRGLNWLYRLPDRIQVLPDRIDRAVSRPGRSGVGRWILASAGVVVGLVVTALVWVLRLVVWPLRRPLLFAIGMALIVAYPLSQLVAHQGYDGTLQFLLYNDFLSRRSLPDHVNFDALIRHLGFAGFPYTTLVPLAVAYLIQTITPEKGDLAAQSGDDVRSPSTIPLKALLVCWFVVGAVTIGLASTLSRHYLFVAMLPMAASVGLLLTDGGYWRGLKKSASLFALIGVGCLVVLLVLIKDLKTTANPELGQLGPEVLFEFLLVDGREPFPKVYRLPLVQVFGVVWVVAIAAYFWLLISWLRGLYDRVQGWIDRVDARPVASVRGQRCRTARGLALGAVVTPTMIALPLLHLIKLVLKPVEWLNERTPRRLLYVVLGSTALFAAVTAFAYLPNLSDHLSPRGLVDTYRTLAQPGEVLYRIGTSHASTNFYLGEENIEIADGTVNEIGTIRNVADLRPHFCNPAQRIFGMLDRDTMARAYYEIRRNGGGDDGEESGGCNPERDLWVVDGRSSRYVLVSNQLHADRGETNQSPISENVFEELPDGVIDARTRYVFDGKLELLGYRLLDEDDKPITTASSGDHIYIETFFRVIERVPSSHQMFVHVDYENNRINGDHDVVDGTFPLNYWVPGEIVRDRHRQLIDRGSATGDYSIMFGFFTGDTRMEVRPATGDNRVQLGIIHISGGL